MMKSVRYMEFEDIAKKVREGKLYQKVAPTLLRRPRSEEMGSTVVTWVKDAQIRIRKEAESQIQESSVCARNEEVIGYDEAGEKIFNEWVMPESVVERNYGLAELKELGPEYAGFKKKTKVLAAPLTQEILSLLNIQGEVLHIKVNWAHEPMVARLGDYLTSEGYSISEHDMKSYAEVVSVSVSVSDSIGQRLGLKQPIRELVFTSAHKRIEIIRPRSLLVQSKERKASCEEVSSNGHGWPSMNSRIKNRLESRVCFLLFNQSHLLCEFVQAKRSG